jgi:hypothetical protein
MTSAKEYRKYQSSFYTNDPPMKTPRNLEHICHETRNGSHRTFPDGFIRAKTNERTRLQWKGKVQTGEL